MNDSATATATALHDELKKLVIETLNLEGLTSADIDTDAPLFNEGLGLDSIDALELGLAIKGRYGIVLSSDNTDTRRHFASIANLASYIAATRA
ncbi:MAG: phosphopantetheine-binding protein [Opitutaceae bacterium]|jgi:acyl carrier protein|nr:phosphopantetheine-binding protein [Opitutaceae bacterium]